MALKLKKQVEARPFRLLSEAEIHIGKLKMRPEFWAASSASWSTPWIQASSPSVSSQAVPCSQDTSLKMPLEPGLRRAVRAQ